MKIGLEFIVKQLRATMLGGVWHASKNIMLMQCAWPKY